MQPASCRGLLARIGLTLILVSGSAALAHGQYQQPTIQTQATTPSNPPNFNFNTNVGGFNGGYAGYGGWGGGYYPGRVGGALQGVASVTTANGQYQQQIQGARILQQQANQASLDTRNRILQQWKYEQSLKPTPEDIKEAEMMRALRRARNDPPNTEIWSGVALNTLNNSIRRAQLGGIRGPLVPVDPNVLKHINVTSGTTNGSIGILRNGGDLEWPLILQSATYRTDTNKIQSLTKQIFQQGTAGQIQGDTIVALTDAVDTLSNRIDADTPNLTMSQGIQASRFINQLRAAIRVLQDPNAAKLFNGSWSVQGDNVAAIVENLTNNGLSFAAAAPGSETFYTVLYNNFLSYDMGLANLMANSRPQIETPR